MSKITGYLVMERCEDYEQALIIKTGNGYPDGGVLDWYENNRNDVRAMFPDRKTARAAINRTEHYRLAFGATLPERKWCSVVPVQFVRGVSK